MDTLAFAKYGPQVETRRQRIALNGYVVSATGAILMTGKALLTNVSPNSNSMRSPDESFCRASSVSSLMRTIIARFGFAAMPSPGRVCPCSESVVFSGNGMFVVEDKLLVWGMWPAAPANASYVTNSKLDSLAVACLRDD